MLNLDYLNAQRIVTFDYRAIDIWLVGVGGTGSWLAPMLARWAIAQSSPYRSITLTLVDPDTVERQNLTRQNFSAAELGANKARAMALRLSLTSTLPVVAIDQVFDPAWIQPSTETLTLLCGCVDNAAARRSMAAALPHNRNWTLPRLWLVDCGNHRTSGQVAIGSHLQDDPNFYQFQAIGAWALPAPTVILPELSFDESPAAPQFRCVEGDDQTMSANQMAATLALVLIAQLMSNRLKHFLTDFDLETGSTRSRYITADTIAQLLGQAADIRSRHTRSMPLRSNAL
ncbi:ThiF family adenylyltransferase [Microcoleus sp. FACHB-1515]|uniref:ThiF family adenylyltransferase n=1 Tax=Cyanophyceae TaxID=3028117 RepID=UPI0016840A24|nr:ThiF family adenylyltransferase [Microcoleus sp. FACHB-1515]MBD2093254.1 ThiF family adenylyltransferase [Microcoleus sp. FACHB-1515]